MCVCNTVNVTYGGTLVDWAMAGQGVGVVL